MTPRANLARLLEVPGFGVESFRIEHRTLWVDLRRHRRRRPVCSGCGRRCGEIHDRRRRTVRDLGCFGLRTYLSLETARVRCRRCGIRQERIGWLAANPRYTRRFQAQVARLCLAMPISAAAAVAELSWDAARGIFEQVARDELEVERPPSDLRWIGVDEKSWRRGRRFCTIVSDLRTGRVVWIGPGRSKDALLGFFDWLGKERCARIEAAAIDLAEPYEAAVRQRCPSAQIVYDRYHVVQLLLEALNGVRKQVVRDAGEGERDLVTNKKWLLLRHETRLDRDAKQELDELLELNRPLATAHVLKEDFLRIYELKDEDEAGQFLVGWVHRAMASGLEPFKRFAREVANRLDGFLAHIRHRLPMGVVEAINSRLEGLIRRARGFRSVESFISVALFVCGRPASLIGDESLFPYSL